ncbi:MAG: glycosyltransferase family 1 protein [Balneolaceae bacterium]
MNINIISCANSRCGIGRYTNELAQQIDQTNHSVSVYRKDNEQLPLFKVYPHRSLRSLRHYIAPYYLSKAIKEECPEIWHADYVDAASSFSYLKSTPDYLFTNVHDAIPFLFPTSKFALEFYKRQLIYTSQVSRKIIVVSEASKEDLVKFTGISSDKVEVIYNGINHDFFYPDTAKRKNKVFTIRYVGGLSGPHKNAESLIEVARILEASGYQFKMEIGGGFPDKTELPQLVKKYGIKSVHFAGFIPDQKLRSFLAEADLFVYPSKYEGFGFPPLEAMACGTATVSSNAGSLAEVLGEGALTAKPDPIELSNQIMRVIDNPELKRSMERVAILQAEKYKWSTSAEQHIALFERELSKTKSTRKAS